MRNRLIDETNQNMNSGKKKVLYATAQNASFRYAQVRFANKCIFLRAHNGLEANEIVKREKPDILITDLRLPLRSGYDVCKLIEEDITKILISNNTKEGMSSNGLSEYAESLQREFDSILYMEENFHEKFGSVVSNHLNLEWLEK